MDAVESKSEVARLMRQIELEYEAAPCQHSLDGAGITGEETAMKPTKESDQQPARDGTQTKPTMQDLWLKHPEIQNAAMIEAPGIPYVRVVYAFFGYPVTQQDFDAVLKAFNRLTGCHYSQEEIAGVQITPDTNNGL